MQRFTLAVALLAVLAVSVIRAGFLAAQADPKAAPPTLEASMAAYQEAVRPILVKHCTACHGAKAVKGELDLEKLEPDMKTSASAARWVVVLDKIMMGEMPPPGKSQLSAEEIKVISAWVHGEMKRANKHIARREVHASGNVVPHHLLFDSKQQAPLDAATRLRRLSPEIYGNFLADLARGAPGVTNPFSPEGRSIFKDMGAPKVDEPVTALLLRNALAIVTQQTNHQIEEGVIKAVGGTPKEFLVLFDERNPATPAQMETAIKLQFERVLKRQPTAEELARFVALMQKNIQDAGRTTGVRYSLAAVYLLPEAIFRYEVGSGPADAQGRVRLTPREIAFALAYALTDRRPDAWLLAAAEAGKLTTAEGVAQAVRKMLDDPSLAKPRILRFFREYFGYEQAREVFKEPKENPDHDARALVEDTERLIEHILEQDRQVLRELLTTNKSFVGYKTAADTKAKRAEALAKFEADKAKDPAKFANKQPPKVGKSIYLAYNLSDFPDQQPVELPKEQRAGILTQPAWLVAFSQSDDNHAILRGKWIRERLLGNVVPDIPITVDAQLPQAPEKTLRQRMAVTQQDYCWKCHQLMNPVGLPFEMFDHFGRFRTEEKVLDGEATARNKDAKGKPLGPVLRDVPVDASGTIALTGDARIEGDVENAVALLHRLAASERVEQVFIRHAFRYWMGRNESLGDAASLQAAHRAYRENDGSMKALIVALLSSDSFLYRVSSTRLGERPD